jgi:hypothetical protein
MTCHSQIWTNAEILAPVRQSLAEGRPLRWTRVMRLKGPPSSRWIFAGGGFFWLLFLYGLSMTDYATRLAVLIWRDGTDQLYTGVVPGVGE